jgi:hypothetical protein
MPRNELKIRGHKQITGRTLKRQYKTGTINYRAPTEVLDIREHTSDAESNHSTSITTAR